MIGQVAGGLEGCATNRHTACVVHGCASGCDVRHIDSGAASKACTGVCSNIIAVRRTPTDFCAQTARGQVGLRGDAGWVACSDEHCYHYFRPSL